MLDEPTSHLDMGNQVMILRVVKSLRQNGLGIVMASHFPDQAFIVATEAAILDRAQIMHKGPPDEVVTDAKMRQTYGVEVKVLYLGEGVDRKTCLPTFADL